MSVKNEKLNRDSTDIDCLSARDSDIIPLFEDDCYQEPLFLMRKCYDSVEETKS